MKKRSPNPAPNLPAALTAEERYRLIADFTYDWEHSIAPDGQLQYVSPAVERITALKPSPGACAFDFLGRIVHPDDREETLAQLNRDLAGRASGEAEFRIVRNDGQVRWVHHCWQPVFDKGGAFLGLRGSNRDVTNRKRCESELAGAKVGAEQARVSAEAATTAKERFIAILAHELRTPLAPAVTTLYILDSDPLLPPNVREHLAVIRRNLELVLRLISDLVDISRITTRTLHLEKQPADAACIIREAVSVVTGSLNAKEMSLACALPSDPCVIHADAGRLQQVFWNLLRNAIKFSPPRTRIDIRAAVTAGDGQRTLVVEVSDQGRGIDPELLPRLFNAFEQDPRSRALGGLGLGLCICRTIVEMHGGSICARSDGPNRGATFTVRLPMDEPAS